MRLDNSSRRQTTEYLIEKKIAESSKLWVLGRDLIKGYDLFAG